MSLRWSLYVTPKPPEGDSKTQNAVFCVKSHFAWRISATKASYENCQHKVLRHLLAYLSMRKWLVATSPSKWKFGIYWPTPLHNADVQSIFAWSASAVTPSKKSSINTSRKSTTRFPMSLRWMIYIDPKPPKWVLKCSVQYLNNN